MSVYWNLPQQFRGITDNNAQVVLTLRASAVEVFGHGWGDFPSHIGKMSREDFKFFY